MTKKELKRLKKLLENETDLDRQVSLHEDIDELEARIKQECEDDEIEKNELEYSKFLGER